MRERDNETEWSLLRNIFADEDTDVRITNEAGENR
jgi:hypothetical protein